MLVVDERPIGPELTGDLFAGNQLAGPVQQHEKHLKRLCVDSDAEPLPAQLARSGVCFKCAEAIAPGWAMLVHISMLVHILRFSVADGEFGAGTKRNVQLLLSYSSASICTVRKILHTNEIGSIAFAGGFEAMCSS